MQASQADYALHAVVRHDQDVTRSRNAYPRYPNEFSTLETGLAHELGIRNACREVFVAGREGIEMGEGVGNIRRDEGRGLRDHIALELLHCMAV